MAAKITRFGLISLGDEKSISTLEKELKQAQNDQVFAKDMLDITSKEAEEEIYNNPPPVLGAWILGLRSVGLRPEISWYQKGIPQYVEFHMRPDPKAPKGLEVVLPLGTINPFLEGRILQKNRWEETYDELTTKIRDLSKQLELAKGV